MFEFYALLEGEWVWRMNASPFIRADAQQLMEQTYGKSAVRAKFVEATHDN